MMQATQGSASGPGGKDGPSLPKRLGAGAKDGTRDHKPTEFTNALGHLRSSNVRTPQAIIATPVRTIEKEESVEADAGSLTRELQEKARRRQALYTIEMVYKQLLVTEDLAYKLENHGKLGSRARQSIEGERAEAIKLAFSLLGVPPVDKSAPEDYADFRRILTIGKGRTLLQRLVPLFSVEHKHAVLVAMVRAADSLVTPKAGKQSQDATRMHTEHLVGLIRNAMPTALQAISVVPLPVLTNCIQCVATTSGTNTDNLLHEFGANIIYAVGRRADALLSSGQVAGPAQKEWTVAIAAFAAAVAPGLGRKVATPDSTPPGLLWELASLLAAHSDATGRAALKVALSEAAEKLGAQAPAPMQAFVKLVSPAAE
jgi:hypothetical protein